VSDELLKCSEHRLWELIAERARPGADTRAVDHRIWDLFGETWAIMFTDLAGFSRQVEKFGILHFLQIILEHKELLYPIIRKHDGVLIKVEADSLLVIFRRTSSAVKCAVEMQHLLAGFNRNRPPETEILLCVGIGYGEMLRVGDHDVWGREVNAASKLGEDTAKAREILLTRAAVEAAGDLDGITFERIETKVGGSAENYRAIYPLEPPAKKRTVKASGRGRARPGRRP
jgi:adenylate cyclase